MEHTTKTTFYIGLKNDDRSIEKSEVIEFIKSYVDAGTFTKGTALWNDELEECLKFECVNIEEHFKQENFDSSKQRGAFKNALKEKLEWHFKQDSVLVTEESLGAEF